MMQTVMDEVYGKYTGSLWKPNPYKEGKGRYLWTDSFGLCNFITLYLETKNSKYLDQVSNLFEHS